MKNSIVTVAVALLIAVIGFYLFTRSNEKIVLRVATTTSVDNTGLLAYLKGYFEKEHPEINLTWIAVGTGQAIEVGRRGDADMVLVHNRALEDQFISEGSGIHGVTIAYNDFIIVGPISDPANVSGARSAIEAFRRIFNACEAGEALFVSRGDRSGTNLKELELWSKAGLDADGKQWYRETGSGMSSTLRVANQLEGYTITDRSTWLSMMDETSSLSILFGNDSPLLNLYRVILVNPKKHPDIKYDAAEKFVLFLVSEKGQGLIGNYTGNGHVLFHPVFGKLHELGVSDAYEDQEVEYWGGKLRNAG